METILSHIVRKRLSQSAEDVVTDALCYILEQSTDAKRGMHKLLQRFNPDIPPNLNFKIQQSDNSIRPDMCGYANENLHVYIENKFWAGLTDNQPVMYLQRLKEKTDSGILLFVAPNERKSTLWSELKRRLIEDEELKSFLEVNTESLTIKFDHGLYMAIISWDDLIDTLMQECQNNINSRNNLFQLKALCASSSLDGFVPISKEQINDRRTPVFLLQLGNLVQESISDAVAKGILNIEKLQPQANYERMGRYAQFKIGDKVFGVWIGINLPLWQENETSPIWVEFHGDWGLYSQVIDKIESNDHPFKKDMVKKENRVALPLFVLPGAEKDAVQKNIVDQLRELKNLLSAQ